MALHTSLCCTRHHGPTMQRFMGSALEVRCMCSHPPLRSQGVGMHKSRLNPDSCSVIAGQDITDQPRPAHSTKVGNPHSRNTMPVQMSQYHCSTTAGLRLHLHFRATCTALRQHFPVHYSETKGKPETSYPCPTPPSWAGLQHSTGSGCLRRAGISKKVRQHSSG